MHLGFSKRFSRTYATFFKKGIFVAVLLVIAFGNISKVFADINTDYTKYLNLFSTGSGISNSTGGNFILEADGKTIAGIKLNITLNLQKDKEEALWDYVAAPTGLISTPPTADNFVIRLCYDNTNTNCAVNTIPYSDKNLESLGSGTSAIITQKAKNFYRDSIRLSDFSAFDYHDSNTGTGLHGRRYLYKRDTTDNKNEGITSNFPTSGISFQNGTTVQASLWYCAGDNNNGDKNGIDAYKDNTNGNNDTIATFDDLCGGTAYFRIGLPLSITIPTDIQAIQSQANTTDTTTGGEINDTSDPLPSCGISKWIGCIAQVIYYLIFKPISWIAALLGNLFDFFLGYSVSDEAYRASFVVDAWRIVRDICNIFFIIIMVYTGVATVFGIGKVSMKGVVVNLIVNALIINFSLFATRVVIDISNITARIFYSRIYVCTGKCLPKVNGLPPNIKSDGPGGYWPISEAIVSSFDPQQLFKPDTLDGNAAGYGVDTPEQVVNSDFSAVNAKKIGANTDKSSVGYAGYFILVSLISALIIFGVAMMFWKVAFMFLGRVIGLYIAMIFAPLAFLSRSGKSSPMPIVGAIPFVSWGEWANDITKYALLAPVFTLFLYIIYSILQSKFLSAVGKISGEGFFNTTLSLVIPMLITYFLVNKGVSIAQKYAGEVGKIVQEKLNNAAGFVGGAALGVATGGVALAGRNIVGRLGAKVATSQTLQNASASGRWYSKLADRTMRVGDATSKKTFDARNTRAGQYFQEQSGVNLNNNLVRFTGTGTNKTEGGYRSAVTRNERVLTDRANRFQITGQQARTMDAATEAWERAYQARRTTAEQTALAAGNIFNETQFRLGDMRTQVAANNARPRNAAETNVRRERSYQASLARGTVLSRVAQRATNRITTPVAGVGAGAAVAGASVVTSGTLVGAAAVVGQGAIQGEARQNVLAARRNQARPTVNGGQRRRMLAQLAQLRRDQLRIVTTLEPVFTATGNTPSNPPNLMNDINSLTVLDISIYQAAHTGHGMPSPNAVIADRNRVNNEITNIQKQLGI